MKERNITYRHFLCESSVSDNCHRLETIHRVPTQGKYPRCILWKVRNTLMIGGYFQSGAGASCGCRRGKGATDVEIEEVGGAPEVLRFLYEFFCSNFDNPNL